MNWRKSDFALISFGVISALLVFCLLSDIMEVQLNGIIKKHKPVESSFYHQSPFSAIESLSRTQTVFKPTVKTTKTTNSAILAEKNRTVTAKSKAKSTNSAFSKDMRQKRNQHPLILYWHYPFYNKEYKLPEGSKMTYPPCEITYRRGRIRNAAAVVFHYMVIKEKEMPWKYHRRSDQLFIWWSADPPALVKKYSNLRAFDGFFNWTWTYRRDSDVMYSIGNRHNSMKKISRGKIEVDFLLQSKKYLAIWIVSNCNNTYGGKLRLNYFNQLVQEGLSVSCCGKCCGKSPVIFDHRVSNKIIKMHKFYLAFESSLHCKDYITDIFWHISLNNDIVPVVWGPQKDDILSVAPLDSFIFAEDFENPRKLVEYLQFLDKNDTEYRKYFRWREDSSMSHRKMVNMIKLRFPDIHVQGSSKTICERIMENKEKKNIKSLSDFFIESSPKECLEDM